MIRVQFIVRPSAYDEDFHRLDDRIDAYARNLPGFDRVETWQSADGATANAVYCFADRSP